MQKSEIEKLPFFNDVKEGISISSSVYSYTLPLTEQQMQHVRSLHQLLLDNQDLLIRQFDYAQEMHDMYEERRISIKREEWKEQLKRNKQRYFLYSFFFFLEPPAYIKSEMYRDALKSSSHFRNKMNMIDSYILNHDSKELLTPISEHHYSLLCRFHLLKDEILN